MKPMNLRQISTMIKLWTTFLNITDKRRSLEYIASISTEPEEVSRQILRASKLAVDQGVNRIWLTFPVHGYKEPGPEAQFEGFLVFDVKEGPDGPSDFPSIRGPVEVGAMNKERGFVSSLPALSSLAIPVQVPFITQHAVYPLFTSIMNIIYQEKV